MPLRSPWWLVVGVFIVLAISSGFGFYNLSVYMNALSSERGFAVVDLSYAVGLTFIVGGVAGIGVARLIETIDVRIVMVTGALIGGAALSLIGFAEEMWQLWLLYAIFGIGNSGVSLVPGTTLVTRWFPGANRSIALSIASTGLSMGGVALAPASAFVIHALGIEGAMPWFGLVFCATIIPIALLLVRSWPDAAQVQDVPAADMSAADAMRSRFFIGSTAAYVFVMGAQVGGIAHLFNHVERFTDHVVASTAVSMLSSTSIVGRLIGGVAVTRLPIRWFALANMAGQSIGLAIIANATSSTMALTGAVLFGATIGNLLMLQPLLLAEAFGVLNYAKVYSIANATTTLGVAGGPVVMGIIHDALHYQGSFLFGSGLSIIAATMFLAAGPLRPSRPSHPYA